MDGKIPLYVRHTHLGMQSQGQNTHEIHTCMHTCIRCPLMCATNLVCWLFVENIEICLDAVVCDRPPTVWLEPKDFGAPEVLAERAF